MQPMRQLEIALERLADSQHYLFSASDLQGALPGYKGLSVLLSRADKRGLLKRVCRSLYLYPKVAYPSGLLLFHAAARLRAGSFQYLSLETILSDAGLISQIPMNTVTLMSSGRSQVFRCGDFGRIDYVHTTRKPQEVAGQLTYDPECRLWRASVALALRDMRATRRSRDLIDTEASHELV